MPSVDPWQVAAALAAAALLGTAGWCDWRWRTVPHWTVLGLCGTWLVALWAAPSALGGSPLAAVGCAMAALVVGFVAYAMGWLGGADGKLLAAVALWTGPADFGFALIAAAVVLLAFCVHAGLARAGAFRARGIPVVTALAPPAALLVAARATAG